AGEGWGEAVAPLGILDGDLEESRRLTLTLSGGPERAPVRWGRHLHERLHLRERRYLRERRHVLAEKRRPELSGPLSGPPERAGVRPLLLSDFSTEISRNRPASPVRWGLHLHERPVGR